MLDAVGPLALGPEEVQRGGEVGLAVARRGPRAQIADGGGQVVGLVGEVRLQARDGLRDLLDVAREQRAVVRVEVDRAVGPLAQP